MVKTVLIIILCCLGFNVWSQMTQEQYIDTYAPMAVKEMKRSGVPASITLSQGILESGSGNSYLAAEGRNHFGIKCHGWKGEEIYADDDIAHECFRKYSDVADSYKDHSEFLRKNSRYHFLFKLEITDYKGWAKGLKKAGYATSPTYAEKLIGLIEKHDLYDYDTGKAKPINDKPDRNNRNNRNNNNYNDNFEINPYADEVLENNSVPYLVVKNNTTIETLAGELDLMPWQLRKYNDLNKDEPIHTSDTIYIKPKRNKAARGNDYHMVESGQTMRDISHMYAVKLKKLYKRNGMELGNEPLPGTKIYLRKKKKF